MFILNHPYKGALHAPDFGILAPIFVDGERIGWTGVAAHQLDVGGMVFGGFASHADDARQEGMLVPPVKIVDGGKLRTDVWAMITGMSRLPTNLSLDLKGMLAANHVGVRRLKETIEQYGRDTVLSVMDSVIELSEQKLRNRLRELPDGKFRAQRFLDHDGKQNKLYRIHVTLTKTGDNLSFDFSKSSPQAPRLREHHAHRPAGRRLFGAAADRRLRHPLERRSVPAGRGDRARRARSSRRSFPRRSARARSARCGWSR